MSANPHMEYSTQPDPHWGFARGFRYGQDVLQYLESLPLGTLLTYNEVVGLFKACGVSAVKAGGVPLRELANQPVKPVGAVVGTIRQYYGQLEEAARAAADCPRYVPETEFPIPLDWGHTEVLRYLLSLGENTLILYERAYLYLRHCGIEDARKRLSPRFDVRRGPPGKEVGKLIEIIREVDAEEQRRGDMRSDSSNVAFAPRYKGGAS